VRGEHDPAVVALALALCSSVAWGVSDFVAGVTSRRLPALSVMLVAVATGLLLSAAIVVTRGVGPPDERYLAYAAISAVLGSIGLAALYRGLAVGAMSIVAPIAAAGAAVPFAFGLLAGERPALAQGAGAALAVVGIVLAARERGHSGEAADRAGVVGEVGWRAEADGHGVAASRRTRPNGRLARGAPLALLAALGLGGFLVAIDGASEGDIGWAILVNRAASLALLSLAAVVLRPRPPAGLRDGAPAIAVGLLETSANTLIAIAMTLGLVSLVGVLASLYPVVTVALARVVLGERVARSQQLGAVAALAGVALIAAGGGSGSA
jgi:drug/metabolite transporter (DMT)-like permease